MVSRSPVVSNDTIRVRDAVDRIFGEPVFRAFTTAPRPATGLQVPVDVFGTDSDIYVFASAPGVSPEALEITINQRVLTIGGTVANVARSSEAEGATWFLHEMAHGQFRRSLTLPVEVNADAAVASFEDGVLRLRLPKAEAAKPRKIAIQSSRPITETPSIDESASAS